MFDVDRILIKSSVTCKLQYDMLSRKLILFLILILLLCFRASSSLQKLHEEESLPAFRRYLWMCISIYLLEVLSLSTDQHFVWLCCSMEMEVHLSNLDSQETESGPLRMTLHLYTHMTHKENLLLTCCSNLQKMIWSSGLTGMVIQA